MNRRADLSWVYETGKSDGIREGRRQAAVSVIGACADLRLPIAATAILARIACADNQERPHV
jgi:hypothetical protein